MLMGRLIVVWTSILLISGGGKLAAQSSGQELAYQYPSCLTAWANIAFVGPQLHWQGILTIALLIIVLIVLVGEFFTPDIVMLAGASVLFLTGVLSPKQFLSGFTHDVILTLAMLFIVTRTLDITGVLNFVAKHILPRKGNRIKQLLSVMVPLSVSSAFLNNTPIVLMMTPVIRRWALRHKLAPSKFLIPLSYATILGGSCTLIGTSCNLIVDNMIRSQYPQSGLGFFELAYIGLPLAVVGVLYIVFIGYHLLPSRIDPQTAVVKQAREFTGEFVVEDGCPWTKKSLLEISDKYLEGGAIVKIERGGVALSVSEAENRIQIGDRFLYAGDIKGIAKLHAVSGLHSIADPHFQLDISSSHFSEIVISPTSSWIGKTIGSQRFRDQTGASVIAVYRQGKRIDKPIKDIVLSAGDVLMCLSGEPWSQDDFYNNDYFNIRHYEKLPLLDPRRGIIAVGALITMIALAASGVPMLIASSLAGLTLVVTGCIPLREIAPSIRWSVLILIGSALAFGKALHQTGVDQYIAKNLLPFIGSNQYLLVGGVFLMTMLAAQVITNNAAALLAFPIAIEAASLAGFDNPMAIKTIGVTVAIAAACSFGTPIGYQTNTIVYGPGGYKFTDYTKVGTPLSLLVFVIATTLIPRIWPMI
ncbi:MAG: SLC13 family permease [Chlamydiota bacterium]